MTRSRIFKLALPAVVALGAGTAVAIAAIPAADGMIHAASDHSAANPPRSGPRRRPEATQSRTAPPPRRRSR